MLYILLWSISVTGKTEAQSPAPPAQPNSVVDALAHSVSEGCQHSPVLGSLASFVVRHPYQLLYEISLQFLARAGYDDASLAVYVAESVEKVGVLTSQLYFDSFGYTIANVLYQHGIATGDNVEAVSLSIVNAIGVVACVDGLSDTKSVMHAVVYGFYDVINSYGLVNYAQMVYIFNLFGDELKLLGGVALY